MLVFLKSSTWTELQAETDRTAFKGIDKIVDVKQEAVIFLIHWSGYIHQDPGKISINQPVTIFIGFYEGIPWNSIPYPTMVKFVRNSLQTVLNITEAITLGKLCKAHDIELIPAREIANSVVTSVSGNTFIELVFWNHRHKLCKTVFPLFMVIIVMISP
jgi:hypothetical protein